MLRGFALPPVADRLLFGPRSRFMANLEPQPLARIGTVEVSGSDEDEGSLWNRRNPFRTRAREST